MILDRRRIMPKCLTNEEIEILKKRGIVDTISAVYILEMYMNKK